MKPSSAIALVSSMPGVGTPAFLSASSAWLMASDFFWQPVNNVTARATTAVAMKFRLLLVFIGSDSSVRICIGSFTALSEFVDAKTLSAILLRLLISGYETLGQWRRRTLHFKAVLPHWLPSQAKLMASPEQPLGAAHPYA